MLLSLLSSLFYIHHLIGLIAFDTRYSFVFEKGFEPKNPLYDERGEGWGAFSIRCFFASISEAFVPAGLPHKMKTKLSFCSLSSLITASVNISQPLLLCEFASAALTVKTVFSKNTPSFAQLVRLPLFGISQPISSRSSLKIF